MKSVESSMEKNNGDTTDDSSTSTTANDNNSSSLAFDVELLTFLETQIYQTQRQFVQGSDCSQLASRVFYQLTECKQRVVCLLTIRRFLGNALGSDASAQAKQALKRTLAALRTIVSLLSSDRRSAAHALSSMTRFFLCIVYNSNSMFLVCML